MTNIPDLVVLDSPFSIVVKYMVYEAIKRLERTFELRDNNDLVSFQYPYIEGASIIIIEYRQMYMRRIHNPTGKETNELPSLE